MSVYRRGMDDSNDYQTEWCAGIQNRNDRYCTPLQREKTCRFTKEGGTVLSGRTILERENVPVYKRGMDGSNEFQSYQVGIRRFTKARRMVGMTTRTTQSRVPKRRRGMDGSNHYQAEECATLQIRGMDSSNGYQTQGCAEIRRRGGR